MEAELTDRRRRRPRPGAVRPRHRPRSPSARRRATAASRPYNRGLFHTGCGGGPTGAGERTIFSLNTAIQAVGLGNYGRDASRYTGANSAPMFEPDEMPGALPEILPSPDFDDREDNDRNIDRCWTCRAMFVQAWGHYGTAWPVVHQQLGVRPSLGTGALEVVPQLPPGHTRAEGRSIRLGNGSGGRARRAVRPALRDERPHGRPAAPRPARRRDAAARNEGRLGHARRAARQAADRARDQPRRRGDRPYRRAAATRWWSD